MLGYSPYESSLAPIIVMVGAILFAFVIDLDYVRENNIRDLLFQIKGN